MEGRNKCEGLWIYRKAVGIHRRRVSSEILKSHQFLSSWMEFHHQIHSLFSPPSCFDCYPTYWLEPVPNSVTGKTKTSYLTDSCDFFRRKMLLAKHCVETFILYWLLWEPPAGRGMGSVLLDHSIRPTSPPLSLHNNASCSRGRACFLQEYILPHSSFLFCMSFFSFFFFLPCIASWALAQGSDLMPKSWRADNQLWGGGY